MARQFSTIQKCGFGFAVLFLGVYSLDGSARVHTLSMLRNASVTLPVLTEQAWVVENQFDKVSSHSRY